MFTVSLSCNHVRRYKYTPPEKGDVLWCPRCADFKPVVAILGPHRAQCHQCNDLNIAGHDADRVLTKACEHAELRNHTVSVWVTGDARSRKVVTADTRGQGLLKLDVEQA